jgi:hypothetical protein
MDTVRCLASWMGEGLVLSPRRGPFCPHSNRKHRKHRGAKRHSVGHEAAFGGPEEANLVDKLQGDEHALLSLVAECQRSVVGHIFFGRMWLKTTCG